MAHSIIGVSFVVIAVGISAVFYNHKGRQYAEGKSGRISVVPGFSILYRLIQLITLIASVGSFTTENIVLLKLFRSTAATFWGGLSIASVGLFIFVWAKVSLGKQYSPCFDSFVPHELIERGPYKVIRHPIYTGNLLLLVGLLLACGSVWLLLVILTVGFYYVTSALHEERALVKAFHSYELYRSRTSAFLPGL